MWKSNKSQIYKQAIYPASLSEEYIDFPGFFKLVNYLSVFPKKCNYINHDWSYDKINLKDPASKMNQLENFQDVLVNTSESLKLSSFEKERFKLFAEHDIVPTCNYSHSDMKRQNINIVHNYSMLEYKLANKLQIENPE